MRAWAFSLEHAGCIARWPLCSSVGLSEELGAGASKHWRHPHSMPTPKGEAWSRSGNLPLTSPEMEGLNVRTVLLSLIND